MPAGTRLGEFELIGVLGEGGFGIVYLAYDEHLQRHVAIKEYLPGAYALRRDTRTITALSTEHQATFEAGLRSFIQEARLLAKFDHPALVKVLRFWEANGTAYMVMPNYQGRTLRAIFKSGKLYSTEAELRSVISPLLDAVEQLHKEQCFHRDISPENIIIQPNGAPVLLDFGAARRIISGMTQALTVVLKQNYAPIEQYSEDGGAEQGPWTDVYALAALMYIGITGAPPPSAVARVFKDPLRPLAQTPAPGFGLQFLRGIDAGLAVRPENRPRSIAAFRELLGPVAAQDSENAIAIPQEKHREMVDVAPGPGTAEAVPVGVPPRETDKPKLADKPKEANKPEETDEIEPVILMADSRPDSLRPQPSRGIRPAALVAVGIALAAILAVGTFTYNQRTAELPAKDLPAVNPTTTASASRPDPDVPARPPVATASPPQSTADQAADRGPASSAPIDPVPADIRLREAAPSPPSAPIASTVDARSAPPGGAAKIAAPPPTLPAEPAAPQKAAKAKEGNARPGGTEASGRVPPVSAPVAPAVEPRQLPVSDGRTEIARVAPPVERDKVSEPADGPKDLSEDARRTWMAAERGDVAAEVALGKLYAAGKGAPRSDAEAAKWLRKAADQGSAEGGTLLGVLYAGGRGVAKDPAEAARLYRKAAEQGFALAQNNLGTLYAGGVGVAKDESEAVKWYRKAAEQGSLTAQVNLGEMYALGQGVPKDEAEAVAWYRKAAEQGNARAQNNLGVMYTSGKGIARDEAEAARWYRRAAEQGVGSAQYNLGLIYENGRGVMKDEGEAVLWYRKAAAQGYAPAVERLKTSENAAK